MTTTIVTALYNINRENFSNWGRKWEQYRSYFRNILSLNCKMVIFVEKDMEDFVIQNRRGIDPSLENTKLIVLPLQESTFFKYKDRIQEVMNNINFKTGLVAPDTPEVNYPMYDVVIYSKFFFLKQASDINYFNSDYFMWLDAGCMHHTFPQEYKNRVFPNTNKLNSIDASKIYITCRSLPESSDLNLPIFLKSHINRFDAHIIGCNKENIYFLYDFLHEFMEYMLNNNLIDCEQSALAICYLRNKDKFNLLYGNWYAGFKNLI